MAPGAAPEEDHPPILQEEDFGPAQRWLGFQADRSEVRTAPEYATWERAPGGLETDPAIEYQGKPAGRLVSLRQGYLAFRPIKIGREWDTLEFALRNETPTDGVVQLRLYYGIGGPDRFWSFRHGFFYYEIPLRFTGWQRFCLEREAFTPYGGPIGWLDAQLVALGLHVTRAPTHLTEVHLAAARLARSPFVLDADGDSQRTDGGSLRFRLTARSREAARRELVVRVREESYAYGAHAAPFDLRVSRKKILLPPQGTVSFTLTASPRADTSPGDATTCVVTLEEPANPSTEHRDGAAQAQVRLHAVVERPHPVLCVRPASRPESRPASSSLPPRPPLTEAGEVMEWTLRAARAFAQEGDREAGERLAQTLRELGEPETGYPALCAQTFYPMTGSPGHEPAFESLKTWYQSFFWTAPTSVARAYDLIFDSGLLSAADKRRIEENFLRPLAWQGVLTLNACANGQEQILLSTLAIGLALQDPELIRYAIDGPFGWKHAIGHDMLNGISIEGSITYMWYVTWPCLADAAEIASHSGIDLFHMRCPVLTDRNHVFEADMHQPSRNSIWQHDTEPEARSRTFMDCLRSMIAVAYPDWHFPKLHDTEDHTRLPVPSVYFRNPLCREETTALLGDTTPRTVEEYAGRFTLPQQPGSRKRHSVNLTAIGWAILRGNDGNRLEDPYLLLDYGPHGGVHGHRDKLQIVYWRYGEELAPDLPICDLDVPAWKEYYQQTASHNTLVLDGASQLPSTGERCLTFAPLPGAQVVEVEATAAYAAQQARVRRLVVMTRDYVLMLDRVESPLAHTIDLLLHGAAPEVTLSAHIPLQAREGPLGERDGHQWIRLTGEGQASGVWEANWDAGHGVGLRFLSLDGEATCVLVGKGFEGYRRGHRPPADTPPGHTSRLLPDWEGPDETLPDTVLIARRDAPPGLTRFVSLLEGYRGQSTIAAAQVDGDTVQVTLTDGSRETIRFSGEDDPARPTTVEFQREERGETVQSLP